MVFEKLVKFGEFGQFVGQGFALQRSDPDKSKAQNTIINAKTVKQFLSRLSCERLMLKSVGLLFAAITGMHCAMSTTGRVGHVHSAPNMFAHDITQCA